MAKSSQGPNKDQFGMDLVLDWHFFDGKDVVEIMQRHDKRKNWCIAYLTEKEGK